MVWLVASAAAAPPIWLAGWSSRVEVALDTAELRAVMSDLPVLVRLADQSPTGFDPHDVLKEEVVFTDATGALLSFDRQTWDPDGESAFWVRIPTMDPAAPQSVWMYFGNPSAGDLANPTDAWAVWADVGVWHLDDCSLGSCANAMTGGYDLVASATGSAPGFTGSAQTLPAGPYSALVWADGGAVTNPFAVSMWFETPGWSNGTEVLLAVGGVAAGRCIYTGAVGLTTAGTSTCLSTTFPTVGDWHHVALVATSVGYVQYQGELYVDGELAISVTSAPPVANPTQIRFGDPLGGPYIDPVDQFLGSMDEIALRNRTMSPEEAHAQYVVGAGGFVSFGLVDTLLVLETADTGGVPPTATATTGDTGSTSSTATTGGTARGTSTTWTGSGSGLPPTDGTAVDDARDSGVTVPFTTAEPGQVVGSTVGALSGGLCGCASGSAGASVTGLVLVVVAAVRRRRG